MNHDFTKPGITLCTYAIFSIRSPDYPLQRPKTIPTKSIIYSPVQRVNYSMKPTRRSHPPHLACPTSTDSNPHREAIGPPRRGRRADLRRRICIGETVSTDVVEIKGSRKRGSSVLAFSNTADPRSRRADGPLGRPAITQFYVPLPSATGERRRP